MEGISRVLSLANKIIKGEYKKDNWKSILDEIAKLYNVDGAIIGFWERGKIVFKHSSTLFSEVRFPKDRYKELYEVPLEQRKKIHEELIKNGYIEIPDYQNFEYALEQWKKIGLKSLLAVAIKSGRKTYGSLHLILTNNQRTFSKQEIETLRMVADSIASELDKEEYIQQIRQEEEKNQKQLEILRILDNQLKESLTTKNMTEALKKIKDLIGSNKLCFLFAPENLYLQINEDTLTGDLHSSMGYPIYNIWNSNIATITQACLLDRLDSKYKYVIFVPIVSKGETVAVFGFRFDKEIDDKLKKQVTDLSIALTHFISIIHTYKNIKTVSSKLTETEEGLIQAFVSATEAKDIYTRGHSEHVAIYAKIIAKKLGLNKQQQEMIYNSGLLHDIGKIGIPDMILLKPGRLTPFEFEIIKYHPLISYEIVKSVPKFKEIANCIKHHHEKMDGSGYPDGLKGDKIELGARILTIADIFDALTTKRPYRKALTPKEAIEILRKEKVDQNILSKVEQELINSYLKDIRMSATFIPEQIEKLRKEIVDLDFMTGLKRRKFLIRTIDKYIENDEPFTIFMVDIRNTSYINFKYGREVADRVILFVAEELKKIVNTDALSRVGADEFMFIYKNDDAETFENELRANLKKGILERIKSKSCVIDKNEAEHMIGCYITFARYPDEGKSPEELLYICSIKKKAEAYANYAKFPSQKNP